MNREHDAFLSRPMNLVPLPPELLYEVVADITTEYIDHAIVEPSLLGQTNPVLSLLHCCRQLREITLKVIIDVFLVDLDPQGSLSCNPFERVASLRKKYEEVHDLDPRDEDSGTAFNLALDATDPQSVAGSNPESVLARYLLLVLIEGQWRYTMETSDKETKKVMKVLGLSLLVDAISAPKKKRGLYARARARGYEAFWFWLSVSELSRVSSLLEALDDMLSNSQDDADIAQEDVKRGEELLDKLADAEAQYLFPSEQKITGDLLEVGSLSSLLVGRSHRKVYRRYHVMTFLKYLVDGPEFPTSEIIRAKAKALLEKWGHLMPPGWETRIYDEQPA
ncbi:hypothetical protein JAAARDRAFT_206323 [Jaapia argillacea MUCL 33604]|uniref:Uncharacterized protein n=1 Tax=Jaapia argillacea MUCL 33604 TaxID=933084 RepID=A0A067Q714_9AGAM|nr:hypothetical protein JAAARDRAFT_206323 [Jaapia argillacea MUCL 33604]